MTTFNTGNPIKLACDKLSECGVENFINWIDDITVDIAGESHSVMIDYVSGGVRFLKS